MNIKNKSIVYNLKVTTLCIFSSESKLGNYMIEYLLWLHEMKNRTYFIYSIA